MLNSVSRSRSGVGRVSRPGKAFNFRLRNSPAITRISAYLHQAVAALPVIAQPCDAPAELIRGRRMFDECFGFIAGDLEDLLIAQNTGEPQRGQPRLSRAEEFSGAAQLHIHFGDVEAVIRVHQRSDPLAGGIVELAGDQDAMTLLRASANASA